MPAIQPYPAHDPAELNPRIHFHSAPTLSLGGMETTLHLLTRRSVADLTRLSIRTIDEPVSRGDLRPIRIGRAVRFAPDEVRRWLCRQQKEVARD